MGLEDFVNLWEDFGLANELIQRHQKDPSDINIYKQAIKKVEEATGQHITPEPGEPALDPQTIRQLLSYWHKISQGRVREYADTNLTSILNDINDGDRLKQIAINGTEPYEIGDKTHDKIAKIHKKFKKILAVLQGFDSDDKKVHSQAMAMMYDNNEGIKKLLEDSLKEKDAQDGLSEEEGKKYGAQAWLEALLFVAYSNPEIAHRVYAQEGNRVGKTLQDSLDGGRTTRNYIIGNIGREEDDNKLGSYGAIYQISKAA